MICVRLQSTVGFYTILLLGNNVKILLLFILDTICGVPAGGTIESTQAHTSGTYANFDHIVIPVTIKE